MSGKKEVKKETPAQIQAKKNAAEIKANGFLNPFSPGVTYKAYLATLKKDETVAENLKDKISPAKLKWLLNDLQNLKN